MKGLAKKLENLFAAAAFAEEGEFETARQIMAEKGKVKTPSVTGHKGMAVAIPATKS
ncbi:MAG: hypothetical protein WC291_09660 [Thermodesulfovibrionales bacterium]|jgi:hypothetical protein